MDAIRILGDLLGNRQLARGRGGNILEGIMGGAGRGVPRPQRANPRQHAQGRPVNASPLGGLIRDAVDAYGRYKSDKDRRDFERERNVGRGARDRGHSHRHDRDRPRSAHERSILKPQIHRDDYRFPSDRTLATQQAQLLIRAMVYAARSDGRLDRMERDNILQRMGYLSPQERQFLDHEFSCPIDVGRFAREVPPGLEDEVYAISLTAIDLDTNREARYLRELGRELELCRDEIDYLHRQVGAPLIT